MARISSAEATNESESTTNTVSRPSVTSTSPPKPAPRAKFMDHVAEDSAFATGISSPSVMFGITARLPGSNSAQQTVSRNKRIYSSGSMPRVRTRIIDKTMPARAQSANIMTLRRLMRSLITPAMGAMNTCGSTCIRNASATICALPVSFQKKGENRDRIKPVAHFADDLRGPQQPQVPVAAQQMPVGRQSQGVYRPIASLVLCTVSFAIGLTFSAPSSSTRAM